MDAEVEFRGIGGRTFWGESYPLTQTSHGQTWYFSYTDPGTGAKLSERNVQFGPRHNKEWWIRSEGWGERPWGVLWAVRKEAVRYAITSIFVLVPLRSTEWLKIWLYFFLLKESIAYFPLVILLSSVISSLAAKKLDKMLGEKVSGNDIKTSRLLT